MKSLSTLVNLATSLSQNITGANQSLMLQLINDQHRYLIQKYFDNERSVQTTTIGSMPLTLSASPVIGDTSATLATAWNYPDSYQVVNFGDGESRPTTFTNGSTTITWNAALVGQEFQLTAAPAAGDTSATLSTAWADTTQTLTSKFSDGTSKSITYTNGDTAISWTGGLPDAVNAFVLTFPSDTAITTNGVQYYPIPANISKITDNTITIGQLKFTVIPIQTRTDWDKVNFLPYSSDIPQYAFIYNGQLGIFPIPSTTGNLLAFNYKARVPDFSTKFLFSDTSGTAYSAGSTTYDYQKGTASGSAGSYTITGASTPNWTTGLPTGDVTRYNLYFSAGPLTGDGIWYPISTIDTATQLTLSLPLIDSVGSGSTYSIAQMPVLQEDFHDMLVYGALMTYFNSIVKDMEKYKAFQAMYNERLALLEDYAGTKQINVDLGAQPNPLNANLFIYAGPNSSS